MYRPNFCAECGEKLLRLRWHVWTSRKFCNDCARRLRKARLTPVVIATVGLFAGGYVVGRVRSPSPPPLTIVRRTDSPLNDGAPRATPASNSSAQTTSPTTVSEGPVYICGARTKKGTPCSRRVHAPVRCWQHEGMPAMLPPEKLLIKK